MTQSSPQPTRQFRGKLTRTSLLLLLPLALLPVAILGIITLTNTSNFLQGQITSQFTNVGTTQRELIDDSIADRENFLATIANDTTFGLPLNSILENTSEGEEFNITRETLLLNYERINRTQDETYFNYFLVISLDKEILVSTYPLWEGKTIDQATYDDLFTDARSIARFNVRPFYTEEHTDQFMVFSSQPTHDTDGNQTGTLIGITGPTLFQRILEIGTLSFAETYPYYITRPSQEAQFVGISNTTSDLITFHPTSGHLETVLPKVLSPEKEGLIEFISFDNASALGYTTWVASIDAALVQEVPQAVFADPIRRSATLQIILIVIALFFLGVIIWLGTRRIVQPILEVSRTAQEFADGNRLARASVERKDEIGLLAYSFNQVADQLVGLYQSLESLVESRTRQIRTAAEVAQIISSATGLDEVLSQTTQLIVERFKYYHTAIYLIDRGGDYAILRKAAGEAAAETMQQQVRLPVGSRSIIGSVAASNQARIVYDVKQDPFYLAADELPETQAEVAIPLSIGGQVLGILDVQSNRLNTFEDDEITTLKTLAGQVASAIQNVRLLENIQVDLRSANILFQTSHQLADATSLAEVFEILGEILQQMPLSAALFQQNNRQLEALKIKSDLGSVQNQELQIPVSRDNIDQIVATLSWDIISIDEPPEDLIESLTEQAKTIGCQVFTLMPLMAGDRFVGLILLGATHPAAMTAINLQPYNSIVEMANTAIEKIEAIEAITINLAELQSLNTISEAISMETELQELFAILHRQITQAIGEANFLIALYDSETQLIEIPYMDEQGEIVSIPSFPLGQGLTSIVIRTQQPLMIIEDTVNRARALGAIVTSDRPALSWLGVPMLVSGEIVGALVVQDTDEEHRFDEDDLRLLTTLAGQVAPTVRNTRLLADAQETAERDRQLYEITNRIRRASSIQDILETTVQELSQALKLKKATIEISVEPPTEQSKDGAEEKSA